MKNNLKCKILNAKCKSFALAIVLHFTTLLVVTLWVTFLSAQTNPLTKTDSLIQNLKLKIKNSPNDTTRAATLVALTEELYISNPDTVIPLCLQAIAIIEKHVPSGSEGTHANKQEKHSYLITKAAALNNIGYIYNNQGQIKEALEYYGRGLKIQEDIGDKQGIASSLNNIGDIYNNQGQIKEALEYCGRSLKIREDIGDKQGIANSLINIGWIYNNQGQIKEALEYYGRSLKIYEDIGDKRGIAYSLNNIALIYNNQGQIKEALEYYDRSLKIFEDIGDKKGIATSLSNISYIYMSQGQIKEALKYCGRSLKICEENGDKQGIAHSLNNIGYIYNNQGQIKEALEYYSRSLKIREDIGDKQGIASSLKNIGGIYLKEKQLTKAKEYADSSLKVARELGYPENIRDAAKLYADIYKAGSNYKAGWEMYELYVLMRDSVKNKENEKAAIRQHTRFEFEKAMLVAEQEEKELQQQEAEAVSRRNMLQYSGILLTLVFMFMSIFLLARRFRKIKENVIADIVKQSSEDHAVIPNDSEGSPANHAVIPTVRRDLLRKAIRRGFLAPARNDSFFRNDSYINDVKIFEAALFVSFLILFEFILVFLDPYIEQLTGGEPAYKLLVNGILASAIFPLHSILEAKLKASVTKSKVVSCELEDESHPGGSGQGKQGDSGSKTLLLLVGFILISFSNISFSDKLDSLYLALKTATHDTTKIKIRYEIGEEAMILRFGYWDTIRTDARKWNMQKFEAHALNNIGYIYNNQGQIKEALEYFGRGLKIYEDTWDKEGIANSLNNIGAIYDNQGQIKEALEYYGRSLKIREDIVDKQGIAMSLNNIGAIYMNQAEALRKRGASSGSIGRQFKEALEYYGRSLKTFEDIGDKQGIAYSMNNIGTIYMNKAEALRKREASPDSIGRQLKEALEYYGKSLKILEGIGDKQGIAYSLSNIGTIYLKEKELAKAKDYADSSLKMATELGYPANIRNVAKLYADVYKAGSNYKAGWEMYELYVVMRDSVKNKENEKAAIRQHTRFEFEKAMLVAEQVKKEQQQQEAAAVARRNMLQFSTILLALVFLFGVVFFVGKIPLPEWVVELSTFVPFMILFEFILVLIDPYIETYTGGEPLYKLLVNAVCAMVLYPIHSFCEKKLKTRIYKIKKEKEEKYAEEYMKGLNG